MVTHIHQHAVQLLQHTLSKDDSEAATGKNATARLLVVKPTIEVHLQTRI